MKAFIFSRAALLLAWAAAATAAAMAGALPAAAIAGASPAAAPALAGRPPAPCGAMEEALLAELQPAIRGALAGLYDEEFLQYEGERIVRVRRLHAPDIPDWPSSAMGGGSYFEIIVSIRKLNADGTFDRVTLTLSNAGPRPGYRLLSYRVRRPGPG